MPDRSMGFNILFDADTRKAENKVGAFAESMQRRLERAVRSLPSIELHANSSAADRRIAEIQVELAALSDQRIGIDIDAATAHAQIERLRTELVRLGAGHPNVQVRADTAAASAALAVVSRQAKQLDGERVNIAVNASDVARTISLLGLLTAGLAGVGALVAPVAAALAAVPTLVGAAAQGVGTLAVGFSGVGGAVKALSQEETKAAAGTAQSAAARVNSAQAIISAQRSVEAAVTQADRAAITSGQQVADARAQVAETYERGLDRVAAAEQDYTRAQEESQAATEDLTRARQDAQEQIEDLGRSLRGAALDEEEAQIRLDEARDRLTSARQSGTSGREIRKLEVDAEQAALALDNAKDRREDLTREQQKADRVGVEGSDQVVAAQKRVAQAAQAVTAAEKARDDARDQAFKDNTRAQIQLERTIQQAKWSQQDAARAVVDAQRALTNAYTDAGTAGSSAATKVTEAMAGLSPETQHFARFLVNEVIPGLHKIRDEVQASLLPKMETSLRNVSVLGPDAAHGLAETAGVIGDLSIKGSQMMTSGPWRADFRTIMAGNNRILGDFGETGLDVLDVLRNLGVTSLPMVERWSAWVEKVAEQTRQFIENKRATGELDEFFDHMGDTLADLGHIVAEIVTGAYQLSTAMGPLGMFLLRTTGALIQLLGELAQVSPEMTQVAASVLIGVAAFNAIGKAVAGAALARDVATGGWKTLIETLGKLGPIAVSQSALMQAASRGMDAAALSAGTLTERFTGSATAGEKVATAGGKLSSGLVKIGSAIPLVGAAVAALALTYELASDKTDEWTQSIQRGNLSAEELGRKLAEHEVITNATAQGLINAGLAQDSFNEANAQASAQLKAQYNALAPLEQKQADLARAQTEWNIAVKVYGPTSAEATAAQYRLGQANAEVTRQQQIQKRALEDTTEAMRRQTEQALGAVEADIRYRDAVERTTQSIHDNGATHDLASTQGRRNQSALIDQIRAAQAEEEAMRRNGATVDEVRAKSELHRAELMRSAQQMGYNQTEAQKLTNEYLAIPKDIVTTFFGDTGPAIAAVNQLKTDTSNILASIADQEVTIRFAGAASDSGNILARASGGPIYGPGTETSDDILLRGSHNEHMWSAREVHGAGGHGNVARMRAMARAGELPRFATGGPLLWQHNTSYRGDGIPQVLSADAEVIKKLAARLQGPAPAGGAGVQRWRNVSLQALAIAGQAASNLGRLEMQMGTESGGDPYAVNRWDINWQQGHPSVGLMQLIRGTYDRWKVPQYDIGPYEYGVSENPLSNILASIRYTVARYGSLAAGWQGHGYDQGGMWRHGTAGWNLSGAPERVLSPAQTVAFERLVDVLSTRFGSTPLTVSTSSASQTLGGVSLPAMIPAIQAAFTSALQQVFAAGLKTDVDYDGLSLRLNRVAALNRRR